MDEALSGLDVRYSLIWLRLFAGTATLRRQVLPISNLARSPQLHPLCFAHEVVVFKRAGCGATTPSRLPQPGIPPRSISGSSEACTRLREAMTDPLRPLLAAPNGVLMLLAVSILLSFLFQGRARRLS